MDCRVYVAAAFAWMATAHCAQAATISVEPSVSGQPARVLVGGDVEPGDGDQFRSKTSFLSKAIIAFRANGGSVVAGIQIGESIRLRGLATAVTGTARCASTCALAWLGGVRRLMIPEARIGFHAAYNTEGQETGVGNALVGAYLNKIGLPYAAVIYITKASPDSMTWLSVADAEKRGIEVEVSSSPRIQNATGASPALDLPVAPARPLFPFGISPKYANVDGGHARMITCLDRYNANKPNDANGGLNWIQKGGGYYFRCNQLLKFR
ncbi:MAG TPA: hypothetical protein VHT02_07200 [Methylocella sp.]|nr:hypothetical protein [Methylocella sp.]